MASENTSDERNVIHCLRCRKPQCALSVHLARVCMKDAPREERAAEVRKATASCRAWVRDNRTWDYQRLCQILPDACSRHAMARELVLRGFFLENPPEDMGREVEGDAAVAPSAQPDDPSDQTGAVDEVAAIRECQAILRVAQEDFSLTRSALQTGSAVSKSKKVLYRYYCEALLVYSHMKRPGAVEALTDAEWVDRIPHAGRVVVGVRTGKTSSMQVALTQDEEACLQLYYKEIRPEDVRPEKFCNNFFVSSSGDPLPNITVDMNCLHKKYNVATSSSQQVRRAVATAARHFTVQQREALKKYLNNRAGAVDAVVEAAVLLDSLARRPSDDGASSLEQGATGGIVRRDFDAFVAQFPVCLEGKPPARKQRVDSGFQEDRAFYDRWRVAQHAERRAFLLSYFGFRKPSAAKVARLIAKEGWTGNCPKPDDIAQSWKPATKATMEADPHVIQCVSQQAWTGLAIKDFGGDEGKGVVATRRFSKGDVVCDYHGKIISGAEGKAMMASMDARYLFFFKTEQQELCVDAETFPCACHPQLDTVGRRINHSHKVPNVKPFHVVLKGDREVKDVILFKALRDIDVDEQLKFDYGVDRRSFRGEGLDLTWLDE